MEAMGAIFFTVITAIFVVIGLCSSSTSTPTSSSNTGLSDSVKERLVKECRVFKAREDVYTIEDKEEFKSFVQNNIVSQNYKNYSFFKVAGRRYAVRYVPKNKIERDGMIYYLANNTLNGWVPLPEHDLDFLHHGHDHQYWYGECLFDYHVNRGMCGQVWHYIWRPATIKDGYAVIPRYDELLDREYDEKRILPDKIKSITTTQIVEL